MFCLPSRLTQEASGAATIMYPEHYSDLVRTFRTFFETRAYNDLIFVCNGKQLVKTHKMVVARVSEFVKMLLVENPDDIAYISLPDVNASHLKLLLNYVSLGMTKVTKQEMEQIIALRDLLKLNIPMVPEPVCPFVINISSMVPVTVRHEEVVEKKSAFNVRVMQPATNTEAVDPLNTPDYYFSQPGPSVVSRMQFNQYLPVTPTGMITNVTPNFNYMYTMPTCSTNTVSGVPQHLTAELVPVKLEKPEEDDDLIVIENEEIAHPPSVKTQSRQQTSTTQSNKRNGTPSKDVLQTPAKKSKSADVTPNIEINTSKNRASASNKTASTVSAAAIPASSSNKRSGRIGETASVSSSASSSPRNREEVRSSERNKFTEKQLNKLEKAYNRHKILTPELMKKLSDELKLRQSQVRTWFNNRKKR